MPQIATSSSHRTSATYKAVADSPATISGHPGSSTYSTLHSQTGMKEKPVCLGFVISY